MGARLGASGDKRRRRRPPPRPRGSSDRRGRAHRAAEWPRHRLPAGRGLGRPPLARRRWGSDSWRPSPRHASRPGAAAGVWGRGPGGGSRQDVHRVRLRLGRGGRATDHGGSRRDAAQDHNDVGTADRGPRRHRRGDRGTIQGDAVDGLLGGGCPDCRTARQGGGTAAGRGAASRRACAPPGRSFGALASRGVADPELECVSGMRAAAPERAGAGARDECRDLGLARSEQDLRDVPPRDLAGASGPPPGANA